MIQPLLLLIGFKQLSPGIACFFCPLLGHDLANLFELSTQTVWQLVDLHAIIGQGLSQLGGQLAAHFPTPLFSDLTGLEYGLLDILGQLLKGRLVDDDKALRDKHLGVVVVIT